MRLTSDTSDTGLQRCYLSQIKELFEIRMYAHVCRPLSIEPLSICMAGFAWVAWHAVHDCRSALVSKVM